MVGYNEHKILPDAKLSASGSGQQLTSVVHVYSLEVYGLNCLKTRLFFYLNEMNLKECCFSVATFEKGDVNQLSPLPWS